MKRLKITLLGLVCPILIVAQNTKDTQNRRLLEANLTEFELRGDISKERIQVSLGTAIKKGKMMMEEIHNELIKDQIVNEDRKRVVLMFQYSDILNGKSTLGRHYDKYKGIFHKYFPGYDTFATTRAFSLVKYNIEVK